MGSWREAIRSQIEAEPDPDILPFAVAYSKVPIWASIILKRDAGCHAVVGPTGDWKENLTPEEVDWFLQIWGINPSQGWR